MTEKSTFDTSPSERGTVGAPWKPGRIRSAGALEKQGIPVEAGPLYGGGKNTPEPRTQRRLPGRGDACWRVTAIPL